MADGSHPRGAEFPDSRGYTEINFAAFAMIGMRFCPRIRSVHRQRIYCSDPTRDHGVLEPVLQRGRRSVNVRPLAKQWKRIGQFYAAFPAGHATASAPLQRLNRFHASNRFYAANRELARALKTEFVLEYMSEPTLRTRVRRGLLNVEQLHALEFGPDRDRRFGAGGAAVGRDPVCKSERTAAVSPSARVGPKWRVWGWRARKRSLLQVVHPDSAGIDVGKRKHAASSPSPTVPSPPRP